MIGTILAIDPGTTHSGWVEYDPTSKAIVDHGNDDNYDVLVTIRMPHARLAIEWFVSQGMPVGDSTFTSCLWVGRFIQQWRRYHKSSPYLLVRRPDVKLHLCGRTSATDANIRAAIIDRYGGDRRTAFGLKAKPGPLYGITSHAIQALATAITAAETPIPE